VRWPVFIWGPAGVERGALLPAAIVWACGELLVSGVFALGIWVAGWRGLGLDAGLGGLWGLVHGLLDRESPNCKSFFAERFLVVLEGAMSEIHEPVWAPSEQLLGLVIERLRILACPLRVRLLLALEQREASVQELADELDAVYQKVSLDLNTLHREGLLTRRRDGQRVLYTLADYTALRVLKQVAAGVTARIEELTDVITAEQLPS
jgi:DNA-binding transcriptional ArsR family regulator